MKKLLLLLLLCPFLGSTQSQIIRNSSYDLSDFNSAHAFRPNGNRIDAFVPKYYSTSSTITLREHDQTGNDIFSFDFTLPNFSYSKYIFDLIVHTDNSFTLGIVHDGSYFSILLIHFDPSNSISWKKELIIPTYSYQYNSFYHNNLADDGNGGVFVQYSDYEFFGLAHIDSGGNSLWNKNITGPTSTGKSPGFATKPDNEGGIYGTLKDGSYETLFRIDSSGNVLWSKSSVDSQYRWPEVIQVLQNGNIAVSGTLSDYNTGTYHPYIHLYSSSGQLIAAKRYFQNQLNTIDMTEDDDGNLILLASTGYFQTFIFKINGENLSIIDQNLFPGIYLTEENEILKNGTSYFFSGRSTSTNDHVYTTFSGDLDELCNSSNSYLLTFLDSDFISAISNNDLPNISNASISITDISTINIMNPSQLVLIDFCLTNNVTTQEIANNSLLIYPNPAINNVTIETNSFSPIQGYRIIDLQGNIIQDLKTENSPVKLLLDLTGFSSGTFFVEILSNDQKLRCRLIKE